MLCFTSTGGVWSLFFFFNDTATTEIYTLSLHDALPIYPKTAPPASSEGGRRRSALTPMASLARSTACHSGAMGDRKSTRLNSSHGYISYAVFCLKKKKNQ